MQILKKSLSILLTLVLVFGVFAITPVTAAAVRVDDHTLSDDTAAVVDADVTDEEAPGLTRKRTVDLAETGKELDLAETGATTQYPLAVGSTVVTSDNYRDILGDGTASYDPGSRTLTLHNPNITKTYGNDPSYGAIHLNDEGHFYITGTYHMTKPISETGLYCVGSVTLDGDFTFYGTAFGVGVSDTLVVNSGSLKGVATAAYAEYDEHSSIGIYTAGNNNSKLYINEGVTKVEGQGGDVALQTDNLFADHFRATSPVGAYYVGVVNNSDIHTFVLEDLSGEAQTLVLEPFYGTEYNVWVGARRVTSENKDDILGDGKASYDPDNKILTLDNPTLTTYYKELGFKTTYQICAEDSLTVKGAYHMPEKADPEKLPWRGIQSKGSLTFAGSFTFRGSEYGVLAVHDITVASGSLKAFTEGDFAIGSEQGTITIKNGVTKVEAKSETYPIYAETIDIGEEEHISTPKNGQMGLNSKNWNLIVDSTGTPADHVVIESGKVENYLLYLAGTQVNSQNCEDIFEDGTASYEPSTKTLTLNNPKIDGVLNSGNKFKILCVEDLTLKGSYAMPEDDTDADVGIYSMGTLTFAGDFTFRGGWYGVNGVSGVTVESGSLTSIGGDNYGIYCDDGAFTVKNGVTKVDAQSDCYPVFAKGITIGNQEKITTPEGGKILKFSNSEFCTIGTVSNTECKHAVIEYNAGAAVTKYELYLGSTQVTSENKDDIFKDGGKAKYDPDKQILTLNDPTVTGVHENNGNTFKIFTAFSITVTGSYAMTEADGVLGLYTNDSVTLDGDFTFKGTMSGVYAQKSVTVSSGELTAIATSGSYGIYSGGTFSVSNDVTKVEMQSNLLCVRATTIELGDQLVITTPDGGKINQPGTDYHSIGNANGSVSDHAVVMNKNALPTEPPTEAPTTAERKYYDLWLGSTRVTSDNKDDILGDGGKAKYDPDTGTLALNDPDITGEWNKSKISAMKDLTVKGSYHMTSPEADDGISAFLCDLTLSGDFTFMGKVTGIEAYDALTIASGSVKAVGENEYGIRSGSGMTIGENAQKVEFEGGTTAHHGGNIILQGGQALTLPEGGSIDDGFIIFEADGNTEAKHAVIEKIQGVGLKGEGTKDAPYLIETAKDWNRLAKFIANGGDTSEMYFRLMNDISVTTSLGTSDKYFRGTFDGNGKTLTVNLSGDADTTRVAPFSNVYGVTIKNLKVDGTVTGGLHCSGLIGGIAGGAVIVEYCEVGVAINCLSTHCGGFIGHAGSSVTAIHDSVFTGSISGATHAGTFWGWSESDSIAYLSNCLDLSDSIHPIGRGSYKSIDLSNNYYTHKDKKTDGLRAWGNIGKLAYTVTDKTGQLSLTSTRVGIAYGGKFYAAEGDTITMQSKSADGKYSADAGTLTQEGANLSLTMPAQNVTITKAVNGSLYHDYYDAYGKIGNNNEGAENLMDNKVDTKWCASTSNYPISMTFRTKDEVIVAGYQLITANDTDRHGERNPVSWTIEGSIDGENWTTLTDVNDDTTLEATKFVSYDFDLTDPSDEAYSYFRFTVKKTAGGGTFQLSELQLLISGVKTSYKLWLGDTQVTSLNKNDILSDGGKAKFDPDTATLTLADPTINGEYTGVSRDYDTVKIYSQIGGLKLKGSYHMTDKEMDFGIVANALTLDGDFTFAGTRFGIMTLGQLSINSGSVKAVNRSTDYGTAAIFSYSDFVLGDGVTKIEAYGEATAIIFYRGSYTLSEKFAVTTPEGGYFDRKQDGSTSYVVYNPDGSFADRVVIEKAVFYDIWLGSTQVTSGNKNDILKDGGKAKFDPKTATLTLNDPTIKDMHTDPYDYTSKIYIETDLTIKGSYHMTSVESTYGIYSENTLTLSGDFTFYGEYNGINVGHYLVFESGIFNAFSSGSDCDADSIGIFANWGMFVKEGVAYLEAEGNQYAILCKEFEVPEGLSVVTPEGGRVDYANLDVLKGVIAADGSIAKRAVLKDERVFNVWVGATQVTGMNKFDILGDGGKAVYTPSTSTLTLNEPDIKDNYKHESGETYKIHSDGVDLTVKGSYHMTESDAQYAIRVFDASVTLAGDFTLCGELQAVNAAKDVTIASGTLKAASERWSTIQANQTLTFGDDVAYVEINAPSSAWACGGDKGIVLSDKLYVEEPAGNPNWDKALHVIIKKITDPCTVTFNMNGHGEAIDGQTVQRGCKAVEPAAPTDEEVDFGGWYTEKECKNAYDFNTPVTGDLELFAKWGTVPILGDTDGDGYVTIFDATAIQKYLVEIVVKGFDEAAADIDGDGFITIYDATAIQKYLVELPCPSGIGEPIKKA